MNIGDIKDLKDKIYELEGLLELAQLREEKIPELEPLILGRIRSLVKVAVQEEAPVSSISELFAEAEIKTEDRTVEISGIQEKTVASESMDSTSGFPGQKPDKPAFCLNDRFRFKRELFGNSDTEFSSAMNMIAAMDSYEEAEEYFIGELGWNSENPEVVDFMGIIKGYFGS